MSLPTYLSLSFITVNKIKPPRATKWSLSAVFYSLGTISVVSVRFCFLVDGFNLLLFKRATIFSYDLFGILSVHLFVPLESFHPYRH